MKIMTLNCGSSSVKWALFEMPDRIKLCYGIVDGLKAGRSLLKYFRLDSQEYSYYQECPTYDSAIRLIFNSLTNKERGVIKTLSEISGTGHRVVHGGEKFKKPVIINDEVIESIEEYSTLAPLHNPANLAGIKASMRLAPNIPQVGVFDTAFFTTIPPYVFLYGLPYDWYDKYRARKYGFHGTSHLYVSKRAAVLLDKKPQDINIITLHIGNGVSITAVKRGVAYDHSMGFTPLEGAVMGTRCGDVDPGILLYVMGKEKLGYRQMEDILYRKSGLLGISGKYSDRREILEAMKDDDERAKLCFEIECYRLKKYIGAYAAGMGGVDAIVFTAGVGENSFLHRAKVCEGLEFLGLQIDDNKNKEAVGGQREVDISLPESRVKVFVIPTNEELVIAEDTFTLLEHNNKKSV